MVLMMSRRDGIVVLFGLRRWRPEDAMVPMVVEKMEKKSKIFVGQFACQ